MNPAFDFNYLTSLGFLGRKKRRLARQLNIDPARLNEIVKYPIDLFTVDKLLDLAEQLE